MVGEPASVSGAASRLHGGGRAEPVEQLDLAAATVFGRLPDVRLASDGAKVPFVCLNPALVGVTIAHVLRDLL
jgi:hypothetical protein